MTVHTAEISVEPLICHICRYDLRAHPRDGKCPECGTSVEESRQLAAIPYRPNWRDSDPRWRRRLLAGMWLLVLLPLMDVLQVSGWTSEIPVRTPFDSVRTLEDTLISYWGVYQPLVFCMGVVLLFSKERRPRRNRLDWTRRWGVLSIYVVLLLSAAEILFISALILAGIAAIFLRMPLKYQPGVTEWVVKVSSTYLLYGPHPKDISYLVLVAFSSITMLLACIPLFNALRSSGPKWIAALLLAPLGLFALIHLGEAIHRGLGFSRANSGDIFSFGIYFRPGLLVRSLAGESTSWIATGSTPDIPLEETGKWCIVLAIAVWLSIAQLAAWRRRKKVIAA